MKRVCMAVIAALFAVTAMADDEFGLYIVTKSDTTTTNVTTLQKITFSNGNVVVQTTDGASTSTSMADINKMYFDYIVEEQPQPWLRGDVNEDGVVNISDVVAVINVMAGAATYPHANVNEDDNVDISDVVLVINIMASGDSQESE